MNTSYDVNYEINKRKSYLKYMTPEQLDYEMANGSISVPEPDTCPGVMHTSSCPRALVIDAVYHVDPCEYCSHSLYKGFVKHTKPYCMY
ncbi:MAG: hypothetical protein SOT58_09335 [Agathobacter sp.]|nr:hypothetical protein [Agathobacter sp.]